MWLLCSTYVGGSSSLRHGFCTIIGVGTDLRWCIASVTSPYLWERAKNVRVGGCELMPLYGLELSGTYTLLVCLLSRRRCVHSGVHGPCLVYCGQGRCQRSVKYTLVCGFLVACML